MSKAAVVELPPVLPGLADLPWHLAARERLATAVRTGRLPHALLMCGPAGVGKEGFAARIAAAMVCTQRSAAFEACGECSDCRLSRAGSHPDVHWLRPPEGKKAIPVDQVRELSDAMTMTSMRRGHRVAIVSPADAMTPSSQNALLKTLEEPSPNCLIVLVSARPLRVLPTLRSRCQRIEVARPAAELALRWLNEQPGLQADARLLELAGNAPLRALELAPHVAGLETQMAGVLEALLSRRAEVTRLSGELLGDGLPARLDWLENWLGRIARVRLAAATNITIPGGPPMQKAVREVNITAALRLVDRIREVRRLLDGSTQAQLAVEALLLDIAAVFAIEGEG